MRAIVVALLFFLSAAPAASTISGRVTETGSGRPLPRILVTLVGADGTALAETLTDDDGRYRFTGVAAGRYAVSADPGQHRAQHLRQWFGEKGPAPRWGQAPRYPIEMADGRDLADVDIAMPIALGIEGRVLSPWEEGMANVPVVAMRPDGSRAPTSSAYSDDLGNYRLYGLAPGRYRVCANPTEGSRGDEGTAPPFVQTCHPSAISEGSAADVTLTSTDAGGIDIRVQRTGGRAITGTVLDAQGMPANGASVMAISTDRSYRTGSATVRDGAFSISGLVPGEYVVRASIGGQRRGDPNPPSRPREMAFAELDLAAVDATHVTLTLSQATRIRGRVVFEGGPASPSLTARMIARAYPADSRAILFSDPQPTSPIREDATFELPEIFRLPLLVSVQGLPDGWKVKQVRQAGRDVTYAATDLTASREPIEVIVTNRLARPVVRVTDDQERSLSDGRVVALPVAAKPWRSAFGPIETHSAPDGTITLDPLPAGDYLFVALTADDLNLLLFDRSRFPSLAEIGTMVTLRENESPRIELRLARLPEKR